MLPILAACGGGSKSDPTATTSSSGTTPSASASDREVSFTFQTGWYTQVESAFVLMADVYGTLPPNIKVEVSSGGPGSTPLNSVAVGQLDIAAVSLDQLLFARDQGIPVKMFMAPQARLPEALVAHKELGITGFEDMVGHKVAVSNGTVYWEFLKGKYGFKDSDKTTYTGSIATWLQDKNLITQAFATNELYEMDQQGVAYDSFLLSDAGYDSPTNMLVATEDFLAKNSDVLPAFVKAIQDGFAKCLEDPEPLFAEVEKRNETQTDGNVRYSYNAMMPFLNRPYTLEHGFGAIDPDQVQTIYSAISDLGLFDTEFDPKDSYTNEFVPSQVIQT